MAELIAENIYYLGPDGSNSHNAMLNIVEKCNIKVINYIPKKTIKSALEALKNDEKSLCVLHIENSIEGIVRETIDNFLKFSEDNIKIQAEYTLPIHHMMLAKTTDKTKNNPLKNKPKDKIQYIANNTILIPLNCLCFFKIIKHTIS